MKNSSTLKSRRNAAVFMNDYEEEYCVKNTDDQKVENLQICDLEEDEKNC